jgi:exopolysaccharide biosynthesis WecB/TagA/CpsF family protein
MKPRRVNSLRVQTLFLHPFLGMGMPKQDGWVAKNLKATGVKVAIVVGALFDYWSGKRKRAPVWTRRMGLEWFGRLIPGRGEPRRLWRRYLLGNFQILWLALVHRVRERSRLRSPHNES